MRFVYMIVARERTSPPVPSPGPSEMGAPDGPALAVLVPLPPPRLPACCSMRLIAAAILSSRVAASPLASVTGVVFAGPADAPALACVVFGLAGEPCAFATACGWAFVGDVAGLATAFGCEVGVA